MDISKNIENGRLFLTISGRLDTTTAPLLEKEIKLDLDSISGITMDFDKLEYLSSAGLRVLLGVHKKLEKKDGLTIRNINETVAEIFDITGFSDVFNIESK